MPICAIAGNDGLLPCSWRLEVLKHINYIYVSRGRRGAGQWVVIAND